MYNNLTLEMIKKHLNFDEDYFGDDEYLMQLAEAATDAVSAHVNYPLINLIDEDGNLPANLLQAILLLIGHLYNNREAVSFTTGVEIPLAYQYLLAKYVDYGGTHLNNQNDRGDEEC